MKTKIKYILLLILVSSCKNESNKIGENIFTIPPEKLTNKIDSRVEFEFQSIEANKLNSEAIILAQNGKIKKAEELLIKASILEPKNPVIISNIANVESHNLNIQKSKDLYNQSIKLSDSLYYPAIVGLAALCLRTNEFEKTINLSQYAIGKDESNPDLYFNLILAQTSIGDCELANESLRKLRKTVEKLNDEREVELNYIIEKCRKFVQECE